MLKRGYTYKFTTDPIKGTITLRPTAGLYVKAFLPFVLITGVVAIASSLMDAMESKQEPVTADPHQD